MLELNVIIVLAVLAVYHHFMPTPLEYIRLPPKKQARVSLALSALLVVGGWAGALVYRDVVDKFGSADPVAVWQALERHQAEREAAQ